MLDLLPLIVVGLTAGFVGYMLGWMDAKKETTNV
jgi:hypothetical protein